MTEKKGLSPDEFRDKYLTRYESPFEGEKLSVTYDRVVNKLLETGKTDEREAKHWVAQTLHQYLRKIGKLK